jgi:hypothetical protein
MSIQIIDGFKLNISKPIDDRMVAETTIIRDSIQYKYDGLRVFVKSDKRAYTWYDNQWNEDSSATLGDGGPLGVSGKLLKISSSGSGVSASIIYEESDKIRIGAGSVDPVYTLSVKDGIITNGIIRALSFSGIGNDIAQLNADNITEGKLNLNYLANGSPNQVLITNTNNIPQWVNQNTLTISNVNITNDTGNVDNFITFVSNTTGSNTLKVNYSTSTSSLKYNPSKSQLLVSSNGTRINPPYSFINATGTGMYGAPNNLGLSVNSVERISISDSITLYKSDATNALSLDTNYAVFGPAGSSNTYNPMIRLQNTISGDVSKPDYTWGWDDNTGIYHPLSKVVGITINGSEKLRINSDGITVTGNLTVSGIINGSAGTNSTSPSYRFTGTTTGIYGSSNGLGFGVNGTEKLYFNSNGDTTVIATNFVIDARTKISDGTLSLPSLSFNSSPTLGIYKNGTNLGVTSGLSVNGGIASIGEITNNNKFLSVSPVTLANSVSINWTFDVYYDVTSLTTPNDGITRKWLINYEACFQSSDNTSPAYLVFIMSDPNTTFGPGAAYSNALRGDTAVGKSGSYSGAVYTTIRLSIIKELAPNVTIKIKARRGGNSGTLTSQYFYMLQI